jgi:molecular chaperone DnaK (HSP70)
MPISSIKQPNLIPNPSDESKLVYQIPDHSPEFMAPEDVASLYLSKLKQSSEAVSGITVDIGVVSVPAGYTKDSTKILMQACKKAGFKETYVIKDPVAAALAYQNPDELFIGNRIVAVLDFGGHSFTVTFLVESNGQYTILTTKDEAEVSGRHLDELLAGHMAEEFRRKTRVDISDNRRAKSKMLAACERTKKNLSQRETAPCSVESLYDGMDFNGSLSKSKFEYLIEPVLSKACETVQNALNATQLRPTDVEKVLLVGGCSRIPAYQSLIQQIFNDCPQTQIILDPSPDEVIARGCGIHAQLIEKMGKEEYLEAIQSVEQVPLLSKALGTMETGLFKPILNKGTPLPCRQELEVSIERPQEGPLVVDIYEYPDTKLFSLLLKESGAETTETFIVSLIVEQEGQVVVQYKTKTGNAKRFVV